MTRSRLWNEQPGVRDVNVRAASAAPPKEFWTLVAAEVAVALFVGLRLLGKKSLWLDEGITAQTVALDWAAFRRILFETEGMHGFHYLVLRWSVQFGDSEAFLRMPSVIFAAGAVGALTLLGRELFSPRVGLVAGFLLALNPFIIRYAQEARGYALAVFLATLASYLFVRITRQPRRPWIAAYVVVSALAGYAHLFALLVVAAHFLSLAVARRGLIPLRVLAMTALAICFLMTPLAWFALTTSRDQLAWIPPSDVRDLVRHFSRHAGGRWLVLPYAALAALPPADSLRGLGRGDRNAAAWPLTLVLLWLVVPTATVFAVSFVTPMFVSRYLIVSLPPLVLLVALGLSQIRPVMLSGVIFGLLILLSLWGLETTYDRAKEDWRGTTAYISSGALPGDAIIFHDPGTEAPYQYYRGRLGDGVPAPTVVEYDLASVGSRPNERAGEIVERLAQLPHDRVWLVLSHDTNDLATSDALKASLTEAFEFSNERQFAVGIRVVLYSGPKPRS